MASEGIATSAYQAWIDARYPTPESAYGMCSEATVAMAEAFPELTRVRGHYYCHTWGERSHWWLTAPDGSVVDPTAAQFPSRGFGFYEPWREGRAEPSGRCMNCGGLVFGSEVTCSDACALENASYYEAVRTGLR